MLGPKKKLGSWTQDDVQQTADRLIDALRNESISNAAYKSSMEYLSQISAIIDRKKTLEEETKALDISLEDRKKK